MLFVTFCPVDISKNVSKINGVSYDNGYELIRKQEEGSLTYVQTDFVSSPLTKYSDVKDGG